MFIVDAQVHIWGADTPQRPWPSGRSQPHRPQPLSKDDLLKEMDAAGVARVVIVPPSWEGDRNDLAMEAARRGYGIALGRTPLFDAEIASGQLVRLFDQSVASGWSYWLVTMDADFQSHDVKVFRQWLLDELGAAAPASKPRPRRKIA